MQDKIILNRTGLKILSELSALFIFTNAVLIRYTLLKSTLIFAAIPNDVRVSRWCIC